MRFFRLFAVAAIAVAPMLLTSCPPSGPKAGDVQFFDGIAFVWIPCGSFVMGSPETEGGRLPDEVQHEVKISRGFWLGEYEVTQAQWTAVTGGNPATFDGNPVNPVETVSWNDVQDFLAKLNLGKSDFGGPYRLPTESEWEFACRAGTTTRFYWGEDAGETQIDDFEWFIDNSASQTHVVGQKLPNAWGLHDMSGNVGEFCQDFYDVYPTGTVTDPQGPATGTHHVVRRGDWNNPADNARSAVRDNFLPLGSSSTVGLRLVRIAD